MRTPVSPLDFSQMSDDLADETHECPENDCHHQHRTRRKQKQKGAADARG